MRTIIKKMYSSKLNWVKRNYDCTYLKIYDNLNPKKLWKLEADYWKCLFIYRHIFR